MDKPHPAVAAREPYEPPTVRTLTVAEAREKLQAELGEGARCPVCDQYAKIYKRALRGGLAVSLIRMFQFFKKNPGVEWLNDTPGYLRSVGANATNDVALLRHWGLIEQRPGRAQRRLDAHRRLSAHAPRSGVRVGGVEGGALCGPLQRQARRPRGRPHRRPRGGSASTSITRS